ncbi:hypothetical protein C8Q72DRAFT_891936 [Fomitopsis betulina]|nr:hypothetical protein C8Q72DRAFT_891936 [Fomitopsis betulina]
MSSGNTSQFALLKLGNYLLFASAVIYFYERILTFAQETKVVWLSKNTGLVIPVAYASIHLCTALNLLLGICTPTELHCKTAYIVNMVLVVDVCILYAFWGAASALRVYAISGRKLLFPVLVMLLFSVPMATNIYSMTTLVPVVPSAPGSPVDSCVYFSSTPVHTQQIDAWFIFLFLNAAEIVCGWLLVELLTKICSSSANALVLFATWRATGSMRMLARRLDQDVTLTSLILADGTVYFCVVFIVDVVVLALFIRSVSLRLSSLCYTGHMLMAAVFKLHYGSGAETTVLVMLIGPFDSHHESLTTICLSRLLLNLRNAAYVPQDSSSPDSTGARSQLTLDFAPRFIGSLGNSVDDGLSVSDDDEGGREVEDAIEGSTDVVLEGGIKEG